MSYSFASLADMLDRQRHLTYMNGFWALLLCVLVFVLIRRARFTMRDPWFLGAVVLLWVGLSLWSRQQLMAQFHEMQADAQGLVLRFAAGEPRERRLSVAQVRHLDLVASGDDQVECRLSVQTTEGPVYRSVPVKVRRAACEQIRDQLAAALPRR